MWLINLNIYVPVIGEYFQCKSKYKVSYPLSTFHAGFLSRNDCEIIFSSEYVKWSEEMLANEDFASSLEVIDVTNHSDSSHTTRHKRGTDSTCPRYNKNYLDKVKLPQQRSLSPWTFVVTTDQNRYGQFLSSYHDPTSKTYYRGILSSVMRSVDFWLELLD